MLESFFLISHNTHIFFAVQILGDSHPCYNNVKLRCVYKYYGYNCGNNERIFLLFCKKLFVEKSTEGSQQETVIPLFLMNHSSSEFYSNTIMKNWWIDFIFYIPPYSKSHRQSYSRTILSLFSLNFHWIDQSKGSIAYQKHFIIGNGVEKRVVENSMTVKIKYHRMSNSSSNHFTHVHSSYILYLV